MNKVSELLATVAILIATVTPAAAQDRVERATIPDDVADQVVEFLNDAGTLRFTGRTRVPAGGRVVGPVGVIGGPLVVAGRIEGAVFVVNGDLRVEEGGSILGDVTVIGGAVPFLPDSALQGDLTIYEERLTYVVRGGEVRLRGGPRSARRGLYIGDSRITVRSGPNYNRVEGLPILFGPILRASGENPVQLEGLAIWRTEQGATRDNVGYRIRLEQQLGVPARVTFGATAYSEVDPIEDQGMRDLEASFTTFVLHRDYRDYFERQGFSLFAGARLGPTPLDVRIEYRNEEHLNVDLADPWTLRRRDSPWRPLPLVAAGEIETMSLDVAYDSRNDPRDPSDGWWIEGRVTRGLGGSIARPAFLVPETRLELPAESISPRFTAATLDVRRYARVGPDADLAFRGWLGGALGGGGLPSQYQHALGGEGSLPGYRPFSLDCGARDRPYLVERGQDEDVFLHYGCDRFALFQVEYRGHFSIDLGLGPDDEDSWENWDWYPAVDLTPSWAVFFEAGRGWSRTPGARDTDTAADLGVGVFLGQLGLYWAYPLVGDDRRVNFFVRLQRRF